MQIERKILEAFLNNPDTCESAQGIRDAWFSEEDLKAVAGALQHLNHCGLIHRFGEHSCAIYCCIDTSLVQSVLEMLKEKE